MTRTLKSLARVLAGTLLLAGCIPSYKLVKPEAVPVGDGSMAVTPTRAWNSVPVYGAQKWEDLWTLNGPMLDRVTFIAALPDGKSLVKQRKKADAQVVVFKADMTPNDLVSMIESWYRVAGVSLFNVESVDPVPFLGDTGLRVRYGYAPTDGIGMKGVCVMRVLDQKLFLAKLDGVESHYFDAALPEFETLVASARLSKK